MWPVNIRVGQDQVFLVTMIKIHRVVHLVISSSEPFRKGPCIQSGLHHLLVLPIHVIPLTTGVLKRLKFEGFNGQLRWGILLLAQVVEVGPLHPMIDGIFVVLEIALVLCLFFYRSLLEGLRLRDLHSLRSIVRFLRFRLSRF